MTFRLQSRYCSVGHLGRDGQGEDVNPASRPGQTRAGAAIWSPVAMPVPGPVSCSSSLARHARDEELCDPFVVERSVKACEIRVPRHAELHSAKKKHARSACVRVCRAPQQRKSVNSEKPTSSLAAAPERAQRREEGRLPERWSGDFRAYARIAQSSGGFRAYLKP